MVGKYTRLKGIEAKGKSSHHEGIDMRSGGCGVVAALKPGLGVVEAGVESG